MSNPIKTKYWTGLFNTKDGMQHPLRLRFVHEVTESEASENFEDYLNENTGWLNSIESIYPTYPEVEAVALKALAGKEEGQ